MLISMWLLNVQLKIQEHIYEHKSIKIETLYNLPYELVIIEH